MFLLSKPCDHSTRNETERYFFIVSAVLELHYVRGIKPHSRNAHEAPGLSRSTNRIACLREKKTLLPDILIFQRFLKFSIVKRECVILARCP